MMLPMEKEPLMTAAAKARLGPPRLLATFQWWGLVL
jgi:hypothetical protein